MFAAINGAIEFYTCLPCMSLLRRKDYPEGKFTLAFVGYGEESDTAVIELTHNWDTSSYDLGNAFGHIAVKQRPKLTPRQRAKLTPLIGGQIRFDFRTSNSYFQSR